MAYETGYLKEIYLAVTSIVKGHLVTLREIFRPTITIHYPDVKPVLPPGFRGLPVLLSDEAGKPKCTACGLCARACPSGLISVDGAKGEDGKKHVTSYTLDMTRCMLCGLCVEACPFDALGMAEIYELAEYDAANLVFDMDRLLEVGRTCRTWRPGGGEAA